MHVAGDSAPRRSGGSRCLLGADGLEGRQQTHAPPVIGEIGPGSRGSRECFPEHLAQQATDQMARLAVHRAQLLLRVLGDGGTASKTDGSVPDSDGICYQANPSAEPRRTDPPQFNPERLVPKAFKNGVPKLGVVNPCVYVPGWQIMLVLRLAVARSNGVKQHPTVVPYEADSRVGLRVDCSGRERP